MKHEKYLEARREAEFHFISGSAEPVTPIISRLSVAVLNLVISVLYDLWISG
jgi:hypothetical protein